MEMGTIDNKTTLKQRYDNIIKEYAESFLWKHDFQEDGEIYDYDVDEKGWLWIGDYTFNMDDVRLDIDKDAPKRLFLEWYDATMMNRRAINYTSWLMGARYSEKHL